MNVRDDGGGAMLWDATPRHSIAIALEISEAVTTYTKPAEDKSIYIALFQKKAENNANLWADT